MGNSRISHGSVAGARNTLGCKLKGTLSPVTIILFVTVVS